MAEETVLVQETDGTYHALDSSTAKNLCKPSTNKHREEIPSKFKLVDPKSDGYSRLLDMALGKPVEGVGQVFQKQGKFYVSDGGNNHVEVK